MSERGFYTLQKVYRSICACDVNEPRNSKGMADRETIGV